MSVWRHIGARLKQHDTLSVLVLTMCNWLELESIIKANKTIDAEAQEISEKERKHWNGVMKRIIAGVEFLAQHNLAFRGTHEKLCESNNGNFLGITEMLDKFDPVVQEHIRRIKTVEIHDHYQGHGIQNELIDILANAEKQQIITNVLAVKYFSIMLDCTPDASHTEKLSAIVRFVDVQSHNVEVKEHFVAFCAVNDSSGKGLTETLEALLEQLELALQNCRGQGYDNGANTRGHKQRVQERLLENEPRAFTCRAVHTA